MPDRWGRPDASDWSHMTNTALVLGNNMRRQAENDRVRQAQEGVFNAWKEGGGGLEGLNKVQGQLKDFHDYQAFVTLADAYRKTREGDAHLQDLRQKREGQAWQNFVSAKDALADAYQRQDAGGVNAALKTMSDTLPNPYNAAYNPDTDEVQVSFHDRATGEQAPSKAMTMDSFLDVVNKTGREQFTQQWYPAARLRRQQAVAAWQKPVWFTDDKGSRLMVVIQPSPDPTSMADQVLAFDGKSMAKVGEYASVSDLVAEGFRPEDLGTDGKRQAMEIANRQDARAQADADRKAALFPGQKQAQAIDLDIKKANLAGKTKRVIQVDGEQMSWKDGAEEFKALSGALKPLTGGMNNFFGDLSQMSPEAMEQMLAGGNDTRNLMSVVAGIANQSEDTAAQSAASRWLKLANALFGMGREQQQREAVNMKALEEPTTAAATEAPVKKGIPQQPPSTADSVRGMSALDYLKSKGL